MNQPFSNAKKSGLNLSAFSLMVALSLVHMHAMGEADMHAHHRHMAESKKSLLRTVARYQVPELKLINREGQEKLLTTLINPKKPVMLNFIFTTCTAICPIMSASFAQVSKQLEKKNPALQIISISVDPEQDTPAKLKEYFKQFDAGSQWQLLTGTLDNSIAAQKAFDSYRGDKMNHLPLTFMRAANSKKWLRIEGLASASELIDTLHGLPAK